MKNILTINSNPDRFIAIYAHRWNKPGLWRVFVPNDWAETALGLGFLTMHWERRLDGAALKRFMGRAHG